MEFYHLKIHLTGSKREEDKAGEIEYAEQNLITSLLIHQVATLIPSYSVVTVARFLQGF